MTVAERASRPRSAGRAAFWQQVLLAAFAGLVVRLVYMIIAKQHAPLAGDEPYYHLTANWLASGFGFTAEPHSGIPSALHPPLYSLLLAPVSWLSSGGALLAQRLTGVVIGAATVVVIGYLGRSACSARVGVIAAWLAALSPTLWVSDGLVMAESLAAFLVALALLLTYRYVRHPGIAGAIWLGIVCGLAILTRSELALLVPILGIPAVLRADDGWRLRLGRLTTIAVAALAVIAPWVLYNVSRFEEPVYVSSNFGGTLCGANNPRTYSGDELGLWDRSACPGMTKAPADQSVLDHYWTRTSVRYALDHVSRLPIVAVARVARIVGLYAPGQMVTFETDTGARPRLASWFFYVASLLVVPFAVFGFVVMRRRSEYFAPLVAMVGMVLLVAAMLHGDVRYRVPADIALLVLAAAGIDELRRRKRTPSLVGAG